MKKVVDDLRLMIRVCDLYYNQEMSQQEIASLLHISRPTLSRLLNRAKEENLIRIEVSNVEFVKYWDLCEQIKERYHLKDVIITDSSDDREERKDKIARTAAEYLGHLIKDGNVVGISMGSTLYKVASYMKDYPEKSISIVPLVGGVGQASIELHSNTVADMLSKHYTCDFQPIFVPARVFSKVVRNELIKDPFVSKIMDMSAHLDIAILGIGYPNEYSSIKATGYFAENEMEQLIEKGVAGEINMQFYDVNGNTSAFRDNNYVIGAEVQKLKKVPYSIGIAGGCSKVPAIIGAMRGEYINALVTDYECAKAILSFEEES